MELQKVLLQKLLDFLQSEEEKNCLCDVIDRMYLAGKISFSELQELYQIITYELDGAVTEIVIDNNHQAFKDYLSDYLRTL